MKNDFRDTQISFTGNGSKQHGLGVTLQRAGLGRRAFIAQAAAVLAVTQFGPFLKLARAEDGVGPVVETTFGKLCGAMSRGVCVFKGVHYGGTTAGSNRFMPPVKPASWTGTQDALKFGPVAPQTLGEHKGGWPLGFESEDCLVLNVTTPVVNGDAKRPVMVWLHGGAFSGGAGSISTFDGTNLATIHDVVVVTVNHRLNVFGYTYLGDDAGTEFGPSGGVGMLDIVAALEWVRDNIAKFGGDPNLVTIFGQSGGGRKVSTLMCMPSAQGLFSRAIIESGATLKLTSRDEANQVTDRLLAELGMKRENARELQTLPVEKLLAANAEVWKKLTPRPAGGAPNSPMVDGKTIPSDPWDPAAPAVSAKVPVLVGWNRTEETEFDWPSPEKLALDEAGLRKRTAKRLGIEPNRVIETYRKAHPDASPWDIYILIATDHPRGMYPRELAKRKAAQGAAPAFLYRFDWETPERGGHMKSPHSLEVPFVFDNIGAANPAVQKMPEARALAKVVSAAWVAFARTGNPNVPELPHWPEYSAATRDTMIFNNTCRVEQDPDREPRLIMEKVLKLT